MRKLSRPVSHLLSLYIFLIHERDASWAELLQVGRGQIEPNRVGPNRAIILLEVSLMFL